VSCLILDQVMTPWLSTLGTTDSRSPRSVIHTVMMIMINSFTPTSPEGYVGY
jgi:hypothetical protein